MLISCGDRLQVGFMSPPSFFNKCFPDRYQISPQFLQVKAAGSRLYSNLILIISNTCESHVLGRKSLKTIPLTILKIRIMYFVKAAIMLQRAQTFEDCCTSDHSILPLPEDVVLHITRSDPRASGYMNALKNLTSSRCPMFRCGRWVCQLLSYQFLVFLLNLTFIVRDLLGCHRRCFVCTSTQSII
ncbi:hypothetical protein BDQ17DRAFT_288363 [Cyathus striatus]|nr:hypothetical protein BDQ17DRAFT_288363 [Cyathus striatus]